MYYFIDENLYLNVLELQLPLEYLKYSIQDSHIVFFVLSMSFFISFTSNFQVSKIIAVIFKLMITAIPLQVSKKSLKSFQVQKSLKRSNFIQKANFRS